MKTILRLLACACLVAVTWNAVAELKLDQGLRIDANDEKFVNGASIVGTNVVPPIAVKTNGASNGQVLSIFSGIPQWSSNVYLTTVANGTTNTPTQTFILHGATNTVTSGTTTEVWFAESSVLVLTNAFSVQYQGSDFTLVGPTVGSTQYIKGLREGSYIDISSTVGSPTNVTIALDLAVFTNQFPPVATGVQAGTNITVSTDGTNATVSANIFPAAVTNSSGTLDWSAGILFSMPLASNTTVAFANATDGKTITVAVIDSATNSVTWPGTVKWRGGTVPTQTTNGTDVITFTKIGSVIYASPVQDLR